MLLLNQDISPKSQSISLKDMKRRNSDRAYSHSPRGRFIMRSDASRSSQFKQFMKEKNRLLSAERQKKERQREKEREYLKYRPLNWRRIEERAGDILMERQMHIAKMKNY